MATAAPAAPSADGQSSTSPVSEQVRSVLSEHFARPEPDPDASLSGADALRKQGKIKPIPPPAPAKGAAPETAEEILAELDGKTTGKVKIAGKVYDAQLLQTQLGRADKARQYAGAVKAFQEQNAQLRQMLAEARKAPQRPQAPPQATQQQEAKRFIQSIGEANFSVLRELQAKDPIQAAAFLADLQEDHFTGSVESRMAALEQKITKFIEDRLGKWAEPVNEVLTSKYQAQINSDAQSLFQAAAEATDPDGRPLYPALADSAALEQIATLWAQIASQDPKAAMTPRAFKAAYYEWKELNPSWQPAEEGEETAPQPLDDEQFEAQRRAASVTSGARPGPGMRTQPLTEEQALLRGLNGRRSDPRTNFGLPARRNFR